MYQISYGYIYITLVISTCPVFAVRLRAVRRDFLGGGAAVRRDFFVGGGAVRRRRIFGEGAARRNLLGGGGASGRDSWSSGLLSPMSTSSITCATWPAASTC